MRRIFACLVIAILTNRMAQSAELKLLLPLGRSAYQTNEAVDLALIRSGMENLAAGEMAISVSGEDGSKFTAALPLSAVAVGKAGARRSEHLHLNGWLLRPGKYKVEVAADGTVANAEFELFSHLRKSSFQLINWGRAAKEAQLVLGEDSLGYNLFYGLDNDANTIRGGVDVMGVCTMSGGHQMDLRTSCDWSDPYVTRGGTARVVKKAIADRNRPNVPGVHFYDEPGLTWWKNSETGQWTPHGIPAQVQSFQAAFGHPPLAYQKVDPSNPEHVAAWKHWARWKLGIMDAAWKESQFGVSYVRPDYLSVTQSQYGFTAFTDGYYFNVVRSLPVISGHGGYHDFGPGYFNPSYFLEMARARDLDRPNWYLPCWYGSTTSDEFRLEQYLSFQTNIQGMMSPPDLDPTKNLSAAQGIVESNHLMARLGTIFTTMPVTRPPVAMLYSLSHLLETQARDRSVNYAHATKHGQNTVFTYLAGKLLQQPFLPIVDEDVIDGTLAAHHKAVILTSIDYLDPDIVQGLNDFAASGGLVLKTADTKVDVKGAVDLGVTPVMSDAATIAKLSAEAKYNELEPYTTVGKHLAAAEPLAKAIGEQLHKAGVKPVFDCDQPGIVATRQASGDVAYLFAVNATYDAKAGKRNSITAAEATIGFPAGAVYDAIHGGQVQNLKTQGNVATGKFRFGPGQMRVFAQTSRPIGGVKSATPIVSRDLTLAQMPLSLAVAASVLDDQGALLSGSIPLEIRVIDPLGAVRFDLFRATTLGTFTIKLPLAVNDPPGTWRIEVRELLANTTDSKTFELMPLGRCGALAGTTRRAVWLAGEEKNLFRFVRVHHDVTIVQGKSDYNAAAAERLKKVLEPWGVRCSIAYAADANKPRSLSQPEAATWIGLSYAGDGQIKPGDKNSPVLAGFAVSGPVILLGRPEDNPLIDFLQKNQFLPYQAVAGEFPGAGRGYLAWQRDGIGHGQESITAIAYDAEGMAEAIGSLYEAAAGLDPLTPWQLPIANKLTPATQANVFPSARTIWQTILPDRVESLEVHHGKLVAATHDGSQTTLNADGKVVSQSFVERAPAEASKVSAGPDKTAQDLARPYLLRDRMLKLVESEGDSAAIGYWGGTLQVVRQGKLRFQQLLPQDITSLAWFDGHLVAGLADGRVLALDMK